MAILRRVRLFAAILLLLASVMPLSECSWTHGDSSPGYGYEYAYALGPTVGALTVLAYIWPLVFAVLFRKQLSLRLRVLFQTFEVLLCAGSIYWIRELTCSGRWLYGAYISIGAVTAFTCAGLASWFERILTRRSSQPLTGAEIST